MFPVRRKRTRPDQRRRTSATTRRRAAEFTAGRPRGRFGWCRLTAFAAGARDGRGGGWRGRPSRDEAGQFRTAHGRSRPAGAAGQPEPGQCGGQESSRGGGLSPGLWARRAGGQGRGGLELPAARSLRISGPEDKKFRSRSGADAGKQDRGIPRSRTGAGPASRDRAGSGRQESAGRFRRQEQARRTRPPGPDRLKSSNG